MNPTTRLRTALPNRNIKRCEKTTQSGRKIRLFGLCDPSLQEFLHKHLEPINPVQIGHPPATPWHMTERMVTIDKKGGSRHP